ncbi:MAG: LEA type 2 family protein [Leptospirales bacterium]|nr:LEA type 2 family protein [Leptospirales bacterium]
MKLFTLKCFAVFSIIPIIVLCACSAGDMLKTYNMKNCEYSYKSTTNVTISNINVSNGISIADAPKLLLLLNSQNQSIPLNFLLTLDVKNPNNSEAAFHGMAYKVNIDGIDFTEGSVDEPFNVASGETKPLPIKIGTDVMQLIEKNSKDAVMGMVKNFIGLSNEKTKVHVDLRPKFLVAGKTVSSPTTFPVDFTFGGKK